MIDSADVMNNSGSKSKHQTSKDENGLNDSLLDNNQAAENIMSLLPKQVRNRVKALKNLQLKMVDIETKFYEELHMLECKYSKMYEPLFVQREKVINGEYEPTEDECKWEYDTFEENQNGLDEAGANLADELKEKANLKDEEVIKGIPDFWLQAFKSTDLISEMIQEHDEPVLKFLRDIKVKLSENPMGYTLEFYFDDNEYFTNKVLTKSYGLTADRDTKDPLSYDGPVFYKCQGCTIDWVKGKDVTVKLIKKKQKHKSSGQIRIVNKEEKQDSFFNFFESPTEDGIRPSYKAMLNEADKKDKKEEEDELDEELEEENEALYEAEFEIGHFFKEFLIPKAVLYFTGELIDEAEYDEEYDGEDGDDDEPSFKDMSTIPYEDDEQTGEDNDEEVRKKSNKKSPIKKVK